MRRNFFVGVSMCFSVLLSGGVLADGAPAAVKQLMSKDLVAAAGKEVLMSTVTYPPGGASPPHRHDAQVLVYVLEGELIMQVQGGPKVTLKPGDTFYESPFRRACGVRECQPDGAGQIFSVHHQG